MENASAGDADLRQGRREGGRERHVSVAAGDRGTDRKDDDMVNVTTGPLGGASFVNRGSPLERLRRRWANYRLYRRTLAELRGLSESELDDIGASRFALKTVAWNSVYAN